MNKDQITLDRIKTIHPSLINELNCIYDECCQVLTNPFVRLRFSSVFRTIEEQNKLYAKGRTEKGAKVTWAKGGDSYHNYGLAVDIVLLIDKDKNGTFETASWDTSFDGDNDKIADWLEVVKIFNFYGWQWGLINSKGNRYDLPHFQKTFGFNISQLKKLPKDKHGYVIF